MARIEIENKYHFSMPVSARPMAELDGADRKADVF
jgi:hypothetical protein